MSDEIVDMTGWKKGSIRNGSQEFFNKEFEMMIFLDETTATISKEGEIYVQYRGDGCFGEAINKAREIYQNQKRIN